jgi:hypothetical protein
VRRVFETIIVIDLYSHTYRQQSRTGKAQIRGVFRDTMKGYLVLWVNHDGVASDGRKDFRQPELSASVLPRPFRIQPQLLVQRHCTGVALVRVQTDCAAPLGRCPRHGKRHELPPHPTSPRGLDHKDIFDLCLQPRCPRRSPNLSARLCTTTQSINQRRVGGWPGSF